MLSKTTNLARILGATAIFYYHVGLVTGYRLSEWGEYAVAFFIIISGIAYTCFSSLQPHDGPTFRRYVVGRIKAIYPMFIAINALIFLLSFVYPSALGRPFSVLEFFLSSVGLSQYFGFRFLSKVMWFIPFILQAYLLFPLITALLKRVAAPWIILAAFAVSLAATAAIFAFRPSSALEICRNWSVLFRLPETCLGIVIGQSIFQQRDFRAGWLALTLFAVVACLLATVVAARFDQNVAYVLSLPWRGLVVTAVIALLATAAVAITHKSVLDFIRLLSAASFPFFLLHGIAILFVYHHAGSSKTIWIGYYVFCWVEAVALILGLNVVSRSSRSRPLPAGTGSGLPR